MTTAPLSSVCLELSFLISCHRAFIVDRRLGLIFFFRLHDRMIAMKPYAYYSIWVVNGMLYESQAPNAG
jgi:hypothetical protein